MPLVNITSCISLFLAIYIATMTVSANHKLNKSDCAVTLILEIQARNFSETLA